MDTTGPYVKDERSYHCPSLIHSDDYGYGYSSEVSQKMLSNFKTPASTRTPTAGTPGVHGAH